MTLDLNKLKEAVKDAEQDEWIWGKSCSIIQALNDNCSTDTEHFIETLQPSVVKELIARIEELEKQNSFLKSVLQVNNITW